MTNSVDNQVPDSAVVPAVARPLPAAFAAGAIIGVLGGMIGLGGAEFRLPLLIGLKLASWEKRANATSMVGRETARGPIHRWSIAGFGTPFAGS